MNNFQIPIYQVNPYMQAQNQAAPTVLQPYARPSYQTNYATYPMGYYLPQNLNEIKIQNIPPEIQTEGANGAWKLTEVGKTPYGDNIYKYTLKNGQTVALAPKKNAATIIKTFVDAGSMNENDYNRGISHFNEHNVFNGSKNLAPGSFFKETGRLGADTNASTDYAKTDFYIMSPIMDDKTLKEIIELHSDMLVNPTFPEDMVEKEKGPVTSEISMCNDDIMNLAINTLFKNLFQINSKSENLVAGSIETVNNITRDDVYNHWKKHFTPDNMYTVLTGDFDPNYAIDLISKNFTTPPVENADSYRTKEKLTPIQKSIRTDFISPNDNFANVFCGFAGPTPNNIKDYISLTAVGLLLLGNNDSRLTKELNPMYAMGDYDFQKVGLEKTDPNAVVFNLATRGGDDSKAIDKFYEAVKSLQTNPPTEEEMTIIKNTMLKYLAVNFDDSECTTDIIGSALIGNYFSGLAERKKMVENLTPNDLVMAANKYLDFNKMSVAVVHPYNMTEEKIQNNYKASVYSKKPAALSFTGASNLSTEGIEQKTLKDGSTLILNNSNSENCYLDWRLSSKDTIPENPACSYVLTQILNGGSKFKSKEDFSHQAGLNSVIFDTNANSFQIKTSANCLSSNLDDAIYTMKEAIYSPRFTEADFNSAVDKITACCYSMNKDASTNLLAHLYGKYFPSPKQILEGLKTLTLDDVKRHYNNLIFNSSANIVITAPFEKQPELKDIAEKLMTTSSVNFKAQAPRVLNSYVPNDKECVLLDTEERNQAQIYKNYSFKMSDPDDTSLSESDRSAHDMKNEIKFELLNTILGGSPSSRLFQDLREKQKLAYTVSSNIQSFENSGILTLNILTTTDDKKQNDIKYDNLQKALDGFKSHTDKLMSEYVTDEELASAKMQLKQDVALKMSMGETSTSFLSMNLAQPFGIKRIDEYIKTIDTITKQDIMDAANLIFKNKPVYSILASKDTVENQKDYINGLGEVINI